MCDKSQEICAWLARGRIVAIENSDIGHAPIGAR